MAHDGLQVAVHDGLELQKVPSGAEVHPMHDYSKTRDERDLARFGKKQQLRARSRMPGIESR